MGDLCINSHHNACNVYRLNTITEFVWGLTMTNAEPPADGEGTGMPAPTKSSRPQRRRRQATALRRYLWWGIVAIAILAPASFIVLYFTFHPSPVVRQRTLLVI